MEISWSSTTPGATEYLELRNLCGMMPREPEAAAAGLAGSLYLVAARGSRGGESDSDELLGMGRVVGDGGCFFQIVDIMVHPDWRRRGIGTEIMRRLMDYISRTADPSAHVNLFANPNAVELYEHFGFARTESVYIGMDLPRNAAGKRSQAARTARPSAGMQAFQSLDLRVGTVVAAEEFPEARKPAYKLTIDFGTHQLQSSAQITERYRPEDLPGRQVVCAVNLGERRIGPFISQCLVLGIQDSDGGVLVITPDRPVPKGRQVY